MFRQGLVLVMAIGLLAGLCFGQEPPADLLPPGGIGMNVLAIGPVIAGQPVRLEAFFKSGIFLDTMTFVFTPSGGIQYFGQTEWRQVVNPGDSLVFTFEVVFPQNDTGGFSFNAFKSEARFLGGAFFVVSAGELVKTFTVDPRTLPKDEEPRYSEEYQERLKTPRLLHEWGDTTKVKVSTHRQTDWERMKSKEKTPLTGQENEIIEVDGKPWMRSEGEYTFHELQVISNMDSVVQVERERLFRKKMASEFDIIIDLRDSAAIAFVRDTLKWPLQPTDRAGYLRTTQTGAAIQELNTRGILNRTYPNYPEPMRYRTKQQQEELDSIKKEKFGKKLKISQNQKNSSSDLAIFGFETYWSDDWYSWDYDPGNGRDYWNSVYQDWGPVYSGEFSAWCSDEGDMDLGGHYDNYMDARMELTHCVYIGGHKNVKITYWVWYETEANYDFFRAYHSYDGVNWIGPSQELSGNSGGWVQKNISIPDGHDSLNVEFVFYSDVSECGYRGAFVDEVVISGDPIQDLPNLT